MVASKSQRTPRTTIPLPTRLKVRNLYLVQGISHKEIAAKVGLTRTQVETLVKRERWCEVKASTKDNLVRAHDARMSSQVAEIVEAVASESDEISLAGLQRAREATESQSEYAAKDFASWTSGVRNLVNVARQARGLDAERSAQGSTLNVFVGRFETVSDKPAIDV